VAEQIDDTRERLCVWKQLLLEHRVLGDVLCGGYGELSPVVEDLIGLRTRASLKLGLNRPRESSLAILFEDDVDTLGVDIFGVEKEAIHVEKTGPNRGETRE
jgi:hypothetical protein